jgi:hypothetical protein
MGMTRLLQIIHVTDLHVGAGANIAAIKKKQRQIDRVAHELSRLGDFTNFLGWREGTQIHFPRANEAFLDFLEDLRAQDSDWFDEPTWLLDTGDLTTFGDPESMAEGKKFLKDWAAAAGVTGSRELFGNHDAWPGFQPAARFLDFQEDLVKQRGVITSHEEWRPQPWIDSALEHTIGVRGEKVRLELYALDSVGWSGFNNLGAVGNVDPRAITELQEKIAEKQNAAPARCFRMVAMHHPVSFPYRKLVTVPGKVLPIAMELAGAGKVARRFRQEAKNLNAEPMVHLVISGHAHKRYPGGALTAPPAELKQQHMGVNQLQLVGSSLMLNSGAKGLPATQTLDNSEFIPPTVDPITCHADLLRLSVDQLPPMDGARFCTIQIERTPIVSTNGSRYRTLPSRRQVYEISIR